MFEQNVGLNFDNCSKRKSLLLFNIIYTDSQDKLYTVLRRYKTKLSWVCVPIVLIAKYIGWDKNHYKENMNSPTHIVLT